jgi:hypothetical protein
MLPSGNNNIYLGHPGEATETGTIRIGNPAVHIQTFLAGDVFATSFTPSDARLKTQVTPLTRVLEKLEQLRGMSFEWTQAAALLTGRTPGQRDIGVLAQDVEAVFPELVTTWGEAGYKAVAYDKLSAILLAAITELQATTEAQLQHQQRQLAELQAQNAAQQDQIAALATRLERLEAAADYAAMHASR